MPKKLPKKKKPVYCVTLNMVGNTIEGQGETMLEALRAMKRPLKIFTKGELVVRKGDQSYDTPLTVVRIKRLFYKIFQPVLAKQLDYLLQ